jgi:hypothetical protein
MAAVPNAAQVAQVLRTAAHLHHAGSLTVTAAIIIAAGRHHPDYAEADTFANAAVSFLAGQWEAASTRETVAMMLRLAADEADRLFSIIDAASEAVPSPLAQAEKAVSETDVVSRLVDALAYACHYTGGGDVRWALCVGLLAVEHGLTPADAASLVWAIRRYDDPADARLQAVENRVDELVAAASSTP